MYTQTHSHTFVSECVYVCTYINTDRQTDTHTHTHTHTQTHIRARAPWATSLQMGDVFEEVGEAEQKKAAAKAIQTGQRPGN